MPLHKGAHQVGKNVGIILSDQFGMDGKATILLPFGGVKKKLSEVKKSDVDE